MSELARKPKLDRNDWTDITGLDPEKPVESDDRDRLGMYLITDEAISFCGWDEDFIRSQPVRLRSDMRRQNNHRLTFPCTPRELVEFVDADVNFSGCLYDSLPAGFREAVAASHESNDPQSDASLMGDASQQPRAQDGADEKYVPKTTRQEQAVITALRQLNYTPEALPARRPGKTWVKAEVWRVLSERTDLFTRGTFESTWERLRASDEIAEQA